MLDVGEWASGRVAHSWVSDLSGALPFGLNAKHGPLAVVTE